MKTRLSDGDAPDETPWQAPETAGTARRSFRHWVRVTGAYFLVSLTAIGALVTVLAWYRVPQGAESVMPRLIVAAAVVTVLTTAVALLLNMTLYYRRHYHIQRSGGYVKDLQPDRNRLISRYRQLIAKAEHEFRAVGMSLHTLLSNSDVGDWLRSAVTTNDKLNITLIFAKPYTQLIRHREKAEGRAEGRISQDCVQNIGRALAVKRSLGTAGARLHIYRVDSFPVAFMLQKDDELYFEPYLHRNVGRTCPVFVLQRNENNRAAFDKLTGHIDAIIEGVDELTTEVQCPGIYRTDFSYLDNRKQLKRALFLDRDGVLINDTGYISAPEQLQLRMPVVRALQYAQDKFRLIVVTNQSGVARGYFSESDLREIHRRLVAMLDDHGVHLDAIYFCPHHPTEGLEIYRCDCKARKPKPGLILQAAEYYGVVLSDSWTIGDSARDIEAGLAAGTHTLFIGQQPLQGLKCDRCVDDIAKLADEIRQLA